MKGALVGYWLTSYYSIMQSYFLSIIVCNSHYLDQIQHQCNVSLNLIKEKIQCQLYLQVLLVHLLIHFHYPKVLPKGRMGKALAYTYSLFHRLSRYHLDGRYLIDNNMAENAIRPLALGRKKYMFCGNHDAAENAAIMYSLLGCC